MSSHPAAEQSDHTRIAASVEAVLMSLDRPTTGARLAEALGLVQTESDQPNTPDRVNTPVNRIAEAVAELNRAYEDTGRSFRIEQVAGGYRMMTLPQFAEPVAAFHGYRAGANLSRAGLETLSIIAYRQPITRAQLEAIRGVGCGEVIRTLIDRRLVTIVGRAEELGRPMLYGTSKRFLEVFGLSSIKDLPSAADLRRRD